MESADLLRAAPLSVVGYSLLRVCLFAGSFLAPFVVDIWVAEPIPIHVLGGSSLVLGVLGTALAGAYHVAYYSEHRLSETATTADAVSGSGQVQRNRAQGPGARDNRVTTTDMLFRDKTAGEDASGADADEGEWGAGGDVDGGLGTGGDVGGDGDGGF